MGVFVAGPPNLGRCRCIDSLHKHLVTMFRYRVPHRCSFSFRRRKNPPEGLFTALTRRTAATGALYHLTLQEFRFVARQIRRRCFAFQVNEVIRRLFRPQVRAAIRPALHDAAGVHAEGVAAG